MIFIFLTLIAAWGLTYHRAGAVAWTGTLLVILCLWTFSTPGFEGIEAVVWVLFLVTSALIHVPALRRFLLIRPLYAKFRKMLPSISRTEREALEAGTTWWDADLLSGNPDWNRLLAFPKPQLTEEERAFLDGPVEELCQMLDDWKIVSDLRDLPPEVWRFIKEKGFFGMIIPKEYGGLGLSSLAQSCVVTKIASRSMTAGLTVMVPNSLGPAELLLHYGTEEQKAYYLPRLARGEEVPCFALTGPEAGSDAASIPDTGIVCRGTLHGKEVLGIRLNWEKRYITLGPIATVIGLAFKLYDPEHFLGDEEDLGITLALVPAHTEGITIGARHNTLGIPFQNGPNRGKNVFIPVDWIVGGQSGIGRGWRMLMECLAAGRSISLPALSSGSCRLVARAVGAYARVRRQFRQPIGRFEGIEEVLAHIAGNLYLLDAARVMTCGAIDSGERPSVISAILKYHSTERMRSAVDDGMDVMGGSAICLGPRNILGRFYQFTPIGITVEGANILTRSMIIFGQGAIRCHPYLLKEMEAVTDPDTKRGLADFDRLFRGHAAFACSNAARALFLALTSGRLSSAPAAPARSYYQTASRFAAAFALTADLIMLTLGKSLKRQERISARLGDILSYLYLISALLKHFKDRQWPMDELPLFQWGYEECIYRIQESFAALSENLASRTVAFLIRVLVLPMGHTFSPPGDRLCHRVAGILLEPSELRDRLTAGLFLPTNPSDPLARLEDALKKAVAAEPVERKLNDAARNGRIRRGVEEAFLQEGVCAGIITEEEATLVRVATAARRDAIQVDDFAEL